MSDNPLSILAYNVWDVMIDACHWHAGMQTSGQQLVFRMIQCLLATNYLERKTYYDICERDYDTGTGYKNKLPLIAGDSLRFQIRHIISMWSARRVSVSVVTIFFLVLIHMLLKTTVIFIRSLF